MLIKQKLYLNAGLMAAALIGMFGLLVNQSNELKNLGVAQLLTESLEVEVLTLRRHEKDFLARKDLKYKQRFDETIAGFVVRTENLKQVFEDSGIETSNLDKLASNIQDYSTKFAQLTSAQEQIGLNPKNGSYGELRAAVHDVEEILKSNGSYKLLADMLQLRRTEKDFMLRLDMKYLATFKDKISTFKTHVSDAEGEEISASDASRLTALLSVYETKFIELVEAQQRVGLTPNDGMLGELRSTVHKTQTVLDETLGMAQATIDESVSNSQIFSIVFFIIIVIIIVAASYLIGRSVLLPINRMCAAIDKIRRTNDLTERVEVVGDDEMSNMGDNFNRMVESFEVLIRDVNNTIGVLNHATSELSVNIAKTSEDMERQCLETDMVATAATEMEATIEEIARKTETAANMAQQANESALNVQGEVGSTVTNIRGLADQLKESVDVVNDLARDSETIGSVLDVIRGIADQTNLLALNAAIEAARAGEQGRGFAVVAEEVRNLALRTAESTQEISTIIESLQQRTANIVTLIDNASTQGFASAEQADGAGALLQGITSDVTAILDMSTQIATAVEEQSYVAADVNKNVVNIRDITDHANATAQANAESGEEVTKQTHILQDAAAKFKV